MSVREMASKVKPRNFVRAAKHNRPLRLYFARDFDPLDGLDVEPSVRNLSPKIAEWMELRNYWGMKTFAEGGWAFIRHQLLPAYTLVVALGVFDLLTRKRLHPMYLRAVACCFPIHLLRGVDHVADHRPIAGRAPSHPCP